MPYQILVVDDDQQVLSYCETVLVDRGHAVTTAMSGVDATGLLKQRKFDLLLLDLSMPDTDGFEILQMVRTQYRPMKVLVMSGFMQRTLLRAAELVGANATIDKPCSPDRLADAVDKLLAEVPKERSA